MRSFMRAMHHSTSSHHYIMSQFSSFEYQHVASTPYIIAETYWRIGIDAFAGIVEQGVLVGVHDKGTPRYVVVVPEFNMLEADDGEVGGVAEIVVEDERAGVGDKQAGAGADLAFSVELHAATKIHHRAFAPEIRHLGGAQADFHESHFQPAVHDHIPGKVFKAGMVGDQYRHVDSLTEGQATEVDIERAWQPQKVMEQLLERRCGAVS